MSARRAATLLYAACGGGTWSYRRLEEHRRQRRQEEAQRKYEEPRMLKEDEDALRLREELISCVEIEKCVMDDVLSCWVDMVKRQFGEKLELVSRQGDLQKLRQAADDMREPFVHMKQADEICKLEVSSLSLLQRELQSVRSLRNKVAHSLSCQIAFRELLQKCERADVLSFRQELYDELRKCIVAAESSRFDLQQQQAVIRTATEVLPAQLDFRNQLRQVHVDHLKKVQAAQNQWLSEAVSENTIASVCDGLKAALATARDAVDATPRIGSQVKPIRCSTGEIDVTYAVARHVFAMYEEACSSVQVVSKTEAAVQALQHALQHELKEVQLFDQSKEAGTDGPAAISSVEGYISRAYAAIKDEEHFFMDLDVVSTLPCTQMLAVSGALLQKLTEMLRTRRNIQQQNANISTELDCEIDLLQPGKAQEVVDACDKAHENQLDANDECRDAAEAVQRAHLRGKSVSASMLDRVSVGKKYAKLANDEVHRCMLALVHNMHSFPELEKHGSACRLLRGISPDLAPVWREGRDLSHFDDLKQLETASRHLVYSGAYDGRMFAIKEYSLTHGAEGLRACLREAALLVRMRHPHITEVEAIFVRPDQSKIFLQMPYYESGTLLDWITDKIPSEITVRRVLWQVVMALAHIHGLHIVHADIKPSNILIDMRGIARLSDFDISVDTSIRTSVEFTKQTMKVCGFTQGYAAPELFESGASSATDIYAFGTTVLEVGPGSSDFHDFARQLRWHDPCNRPEAKELLKHTFFQSVFEWRRQEKRECCICLDDSQLLSMGIECDYQKGPPHFVCDACLDRHVSESVGAELRLQEKREGRVRCPVHQCTSQVYLDADLAKHLSAATFDRYMQGRVKLLELKYIAEMDKQMKTRLDAELKKLEALSGEQRRVLAERNYIVEEILTLKCPRAECRQAFIDFEGCFALTCSRCGSGFCAWCGCDCGTDAHEHVRTCQNKPEDADTYFGTKAQFEAKQQERKKNQLHQHLNTLDPELRAAVLKEIHQELSDCGLAGVSH